MMETQDLKDKAEDLTSHVGDYLDSFYKLTMLNLSQKATNAVSAAISLIVVCTLGMFVLLFGGIALAWWLGDLVDSRVGGFLIVAGFYLLVAIIIISLRKTMVFPYFRNLIIRKVYE